MCMYITDVCTGKYPNRNYPKIFDDEAVGEEAKKVFQDAEEMLQNIIDNKLIRGKVGFSMVSSFLFVFCPWFSLLFVVF